MKKQLFIIILLFFSCEEKSDFSCEEFKTGIFLVYNDDDTLLNVIERDAEIQLEFIPYTDNIGAMSKIFWTSSCDYELKKVIENKSNDDELLVSVTEIKGDTTFVKSKYKNDILTRLNPVHYYFIKVNDHLDKRFKEAKSLINKGVLPPSAKSWN